MAVGLNLDTESIQITGIPSGTAGTLTESPGGTFGFCNFGIGVWVYRPSSGNSYSLTSDGYIISGKSGAREIRVGFDNTFGVGDATAPLLNVVFNSGGGTGSVQTFASANFLDEWVYYFFYESGGTHHAGYIRLSSPTTVVKISRTNDNAASQYINTLTFGNGPDNDAVTMGNYAFARAKNVAGLTDADIIAWAASNAPIAGDWGFWPLVDNSDTGDDSGNARTLTFNGTLSSESSPPFPPTISAQPTDQTAADGGTATFTITSADASSYQWETQASLGGSWSNVSGGSGGTTNSYTTPTLSKATDAGRQYRCVATNSGGNTTSSPASLRVTAIPTSYAASVGMVIGSNDSHVGATYIGSNDAPIGGGSNPDEDVGLSTETDTAFATGGYKSVTAGLSSETDTSFTTTLVKIKAAELSVETDTSFGLSGIKAATVALAISTEIALALTGTKLVTPSFASETDTSFAVTSFKAATPGFSAETDTAYGLGRTVVIGISTETDTSFGLVGVKSAATGRADETDTALAVTKFKSVNTGLATTTDVGFALSGFKATVPTLSTEIDTAFPLTVGNSFNLDAALETDTAFALSGVKFGNTGQSTETDLATPASYTYFRNTPLSVETDTALALVSGMSYFPGICESFETAFALPYTHTRNVGLCIETDYAFRPTSPLPPLTNEDPLYNLIQFTEQPNYIEIWYDGVNATWLASLQVSLNQLRVDFNNSINIVDGQLNNLNTNIGGLNALVTAQGAAITSEAIARAAADNTLGVDSLNRHLEAMDAIEAEVEARGAALLAEAAARGAAIIDATATVVSDVAALATSVSGMATELGAATANIITVTDALSLEESARIAQYTALQADYDDNSAAIISEISARADADSALVVYIDGIVASAAGNKTYRQDTEPSTGMVAGDLWFDSNDNNKAYRYSGSAWVATDDTRIATNEASIVTEATARASGDSALASSITTVSTTVSGHTSTLTTQASAISGIQAKYSLTLDINGRITGYQVIGTGTSTDFIIRADTFKIYDGVSDVVPFSVSAGTVTMSNVVINGSLVVAGTITAPKIADNSLTANQYATSGGTFDHTSWTTRGTVTITPTGTASKIRIDCGGVVIIGDSAGTTCRVEVQLLRNGSVSFGPITIARNAADRPVPFTFFDVDTGVSGAQVYELQFRASVTHGAGDPHLADFTQLLAFEFVK